MRVYHFVNAKHGLDNLKKRRLKISTLKELNDPFELFGVNLRDEMLRRAFHEMKEELSQNYGILCFSRNWRNPVLWSHYADRHKGLCMAFDVPDDLLGSVHYSRKRLVVDVESLRHPRELSPDIARKFLFSKYSHWRYEDEVRSFITLDERDSETGLYFTEFGESLRLSVIIVGAQSSITRSEISDALGDLKNVLTFKTRLAFKSFRVVRQQAAGLWV